MEKLTETRRDGICLPEEIRKEVICGDGRGKTALAIGKCLRASAMGQSVIIIQFLKGSDSGDADYLEDLDNHDIKIFRFEKQESCFQELSEEEQKEEKNNILNGLNFAHKVIATRECDFLVLDEILGVIEIGIVSKEGVLDLLDLVEGSMHVILTGRNLPDWLKDHVDSMTRITTEDY